MTTYLPYLDRALNRRYGLGGHLQTKYLVYGDKISDFWRGEEGVKFRLNIHQIASANTISSVWRQNIGFSAR